MSAPTRMPSPRCAHRRTLEDPTGIAYFRVSLKNIQRRTLAYSFVAPPYSLVSYTRCATSTRPRGGLDSSSERVRLLLSSAFLYYILTLATQRISRLYGDDGRIENMEKMGYLFVAL